MNDCFHTVPRPNQDGIVSLDVGGVVYRTFCSTLVHASPYFAAMFSGNHRPAETYTDANGLTVYFIDRDGPIFQYILKFLRNRSLPIAPEDRPLWRDLREEAEYYALDDLLDLLQITIEPNRRGQGVMYWLGTHRGTSTNYENPYEIGEVDVTGWMDEPSNRHATAHSGHNSRKADVQYQPEVKFDFQMKENGYTQFISQFAPAVRTPLGGTFCCGQGAKFHTDIVLNNIKVKPTHYSLRFSEHKVLCSWDFLGSVNGEEWIVLHQARRKHLVGDPTYDLAQRFRSMTFDSRFNPPEEHQHIVLAYAEKYFRHTFEIDTADTPFCRYFRFQKAFDDGVHGSVNVTGFELYGKIEQD